MAATSEDLPADGYPTRPTSAMLFSSMTASKASPGSPRRAKPGALRRGGGRAGVAPPAPPAVAAVGTAERLELLAVHGRDPVAAVAGCHVHGHAIDERGHGCG